MKGKIFALTMLFSLVLIVCCTKNANEEEKHRTIPSNAQTFEVSPAKGDTINKTDINGFKQGHWIYYRQHYNPGDMVTVIEEGEYVNNQKQGRWTYYDSSGKVSRIVKFKNDMAQYK